MSFQTNYAKGLLTSEPTNWNEALVPFYDRQKKQLEEHHTNLRAQDKALVAKAESESLAKQLEGLASFSSSIQKLNQRRKQKKAEKELEAGNKLLANITKAGATLDDYKAFSESYAIKKAEIKNDYQAYKETLKLLQESNPNLYTAMSGLSAYESVFATEFMGKQVLNSLTEREMLREFTTNDDKTDIDNYNNSDNKAAILNKWRLNKLSHFNFSDEFIANQIAPDLSKRVSTTNNLATNSKIQQISTDADIELTAGIENGNVKETISKKYIDLLASYKGKVDSKTGLTEDGLTANQAASRDLTPILSRLLLDEKIKFDASGLNEYLRATIEHKGGGKDNRIFFNKEQINELVASSVLGAGRAEDLRQLELKGRFEQIINLRNARKFETQTHYIAELEQLTKEGFAGGDTFDAAKNFDISVLNKNNQANLEAIWTKKISEGLHKVTQTEIDAISNPIVKDMVQRQFDRLEKARVDYGNLDESILGEIFDSRKKLPYVKGQTEHPVATAISNEIDRAAAAFELELVNRQYGSDGVFTKNENIETLVNEFKRNLFKSKGGGSAKGTGLYSVNNKGEFKNYTDNVFKVEQAVANHNLKLSPLTSETWTKGVLQYSNMDRKDIIESGVFDIVDIRGLIETGDLSDKMEFYSDHLNIPVEDLIKGSIEAIVADDDLNKEAQILGLEDYKNKHSDIKAAKETINNVLTRGFLRFDGALPEGQESFNAIAAADLQYLLNKPWHLLTDNQKGRIFSTLTANDEVSQETSKDAFTDSRRTILRDLDKQRDVTGALENFNQSIIPYDQNLVEQTGTEETGTANITPEVGVVTTGPDGKTYHLSPSGWAEISGAEGNFPTVKFYDLLPDQRPNVSVEEGISSIDYPDGIKREHIRYNSKTKQWELKPLE